jgi:uncharacterized protein (UPF0297 family)
MYDNFILGGDRMQDKTMTFSIGGNREEDIKKIMTTVYQALQEKGYNPISQIVGYILSEDPTYITTHNNARSLIRKVDRDELLQVLVKSYLQT